MLRRHARRNRHVNPSTLYTVERLLHYLLLVIGRLWALGVAGIPMAKMTVFAGALGVGLGFGLQAIFNHSVPGLILLFDRSLKVGDFVELASGVHGRVREIRIRATLISTNDDIDAHGNDAVRDVERDMAEASASHPHNHSPQDPDAAR